jgi:hypothetical protein
MINYACKTWTEFYHRFRSKFLRVLNKELPSVYVKMYALTSAGVDLLFSDTILRDVSSGINS